MFFCKFISFNNSFRHDIAAAETCDKTKYRRSGLDAIKRVLDLARPYSAKTVGDVPIVNRNLLNLSSVNISHYLTNCLDRTGPEHLHLNESYLFAGQPKAVNHDASGP